MKEVGTERLNNLHIIIEIPSAKLQSGYRAHFLKAPFPPLWRAQGHPYAALVGCGGASQVCLSEASVC